MHRSGLLVSSLVLVIAGCDVHVKLGESEGEKLDRSQLDRLFEELQLQAGVEGTDERCPADVQAGGSYTCTVRTVVGEQLVDLTVDRDGSANMKWQRPIVGGSVLAAKMATLADGSHHAFDCTGKVLQADDAAAVVICPEERRETAHIVIRGTGGDTIVARYYDDVTATIEKAVGGAVERIDCPGAATIRHVAPFLCEVWQGGRLLGVELTHTPDGWDVRTADLGPVPALD